MEQNSQTPITPNNGGTTPPTQKKGSKKKKVVFIIVGASIAFFFLLTCIGGVTAFILIQNQNKGFSWSDDDDYDEIAIYDDYDDEQDDDYIYANAITDYEEPVVEEVYDDEYIEDDDYYGTNADIFTKKLTESDLVGASKYDLEIMRNMIYAWHGYKFKRQDLTEYFSQFSWYTPTNSDASSVYNEFSAIEKYNVEFIKKHE